MAAPEGPGHGPSPFRSPNFRKLFVGTVVSSLGGAAANVAFSWAVFDATHQTFAVTLLGLAGFAPSLSVGLVAGALADRYDRRRLMVIADLARAAAVAALVAVLMVRGFDLATVLVVAVLLSAFGALFRPASNALLPALLPPESLPDANGYLTSGMTGAGFAGSALGGSLILAVGTVASFSLNAATYLASAVALLLITAPLASACRAHPGGGRLQIFREVGEGLAYVRRQPALFYTILASLAANFFLALYGIYTVLYVPLSLHAGADVYGLLIAVNALGYGIGSVLVGRFGLVRWTGYVYILGWSAVGLLILALAELPMVAVALPASGGIGVLAGVSNTSYLSCTQRIVPPELLGRFFSIDEVGSFAVIPLGQIAGGLLIAGFGITATFAWAGIGLFASTILLLGSRAARELAPPPLPSGPGAGAAGLDDLQ